MLNSVLSKFSLSVRLSIKGAVAFFCVVLSVALPQIAHAAGGVQAGAIYMPIYAPALLAGCLLGWQWGLGVGLIAPVVSFGFTSVALGSAMPNLTRLPYTMLEDGAYGLICGLFSKKIEKNVYLAFPVVLLAQVSGRAIYVIYNLIAGKTFAYLWSSVQTGLTGLYIQLIAVPLIVIALFFALRRESDEK